MEPIAAFSLAASILQVVQFAQSLFSDTTRLYKQAQDALPGVTNVDLITKDFVLRVKAMQASAACKGEAVDESMKTIYENCLSTSDELFLILNKLSIATKGKKWMSFKQSLYAMRRKDQIDDLVKRLEGLRQEVHLAMTVSIQNQTSQLSQKLDNQSTLVQKVLDLMEDKPKELGAPWEIGVPEDHLRIDDGLGSEYFLPIELCDTPTDFFNLLKHKYESMKLPGLSQVKQGHILIWEWNERHLVSKENWSKVIKGDRALKVSFVMGNWHGPPRNRCLRCYKPRSDSSLTSAFKACSSCKLAVQWVDPDYLPFEPEDIEIFGKDSYRDYKAKSRKPKAPNKPQASNPTTNSQQKKSKQDRVPSIELVCHRLTMKWEPFYNIVHRYLGCRCVARLSTPSRLIEETTVLCNSICPRHNTEGITFRDYSELALPCHEDPYFKKFGGYNAFWELLRRYLPEIYEHLGGSKAITERELLYGNIDLLELVKVDEDAPRRLFKEYYAGVIDYFGSQGMELPIELEMDFEERKVKREQESKEKLGFNVHFSEELLERHREDILNSPVFRELDEIVNGGWDGRPHWVIGDW